MSLIDDIKDIISPKPQLNWDTSNGTVKLKENSPHAKLKKVELSGLDTSSFILKLDYYAKVSPYFNVDCQHGLNKGCDGLILTTINGKKYLFICELKSSYNSKDLKQFRNSDLFTEYIDTILKRYYTTSLNNVKKVFVLFTKGNISKRPVGKPNPRKVKINGLTFFHVEGRRKMNLRLIS